MDYKKIKQNLERGGSQRDSGLPFPGYGGVTAQSEEPFAGYGEEVYCRDEDKKVDTYGGETKVMQDVEQLKCPSCGAPTVYDAEAGALACPYCGTLQKIKAGRAVERALKLGADPAAQWKDETRVYRCGNCGATSVFTKMDIAAKCPFCGSSGVVDVSDIEGVRPNAVIPFSIGDETARRAYRKWIKRKAYAPRVFKQKNGKIEGVYVPAWTFDSATRSAYRARVGDYYTVWVGSGKNRHSETRIKYRNVSGQYAKAFDDLLVPSGTQVAKGSFDAICPFPTGTAVTYNPAFLTGFSAEHYSVTLSDGWCTAQQAMKTQIHAGISQELQGSCDVIQSIDFTTDFSANKFKYVLLPVYVSHREFRGKNYLGFVNGVNGRAVGAYPKSKFKIAGTVFGILLALAGIAIGVLVGLGILF